ncbi:MAG: serine/threonine protein kinase [Vicinamibacteria bacterium]|nr:serine/threonine protein kinase [Vicinamibacteria bacterium]
MTTSTKYRILHELGGGGMGRIFKGLLVGQAGFQRPVVIKRLRYSSDQNLLRLFVQEARRYAVLDHENIGRIFDFENVAGEMSIIMEYIDGWSLVDYLEAHRRLGRIPDVEMTVFIVSRICRALQYVFERAAMVHRDVSPSNVMMSREGTVKLIDFGIATRCGTKDVHLTGKPAYMAPEMILERRVDHRSDIFSLGVVFYEMLTLSRLFQAPRADDTLARILDDEQASPRRLNPAVPEAVEAIVQRALMRDPDERYVSAAEMGVACEHHLYDKGYGPTNLTLKQHLGRLFAVDAAVIPDENPTPAAVRAPENEMGKMKINMGLYHDQAAVVTQISRDRRPQCARRIRVRSRIAE